MPRSACEGGAMGKVVDDGRLRCCDVALRVDRFSHFAHTPMVILHDPHVHWQRAPKCVDLLELSELVRERSQTK